MVSIPEKKNKKKKKRVGGAEKSGIEGLDGVMTNIDLHGTV